MEENTGLTVIILEIQALFRGLCTTCRCNCLRKAELPEEGIAKGYLAVVVILVSMRVGIRLHTIIIVCTRWRQRSRAVRACWTVRIILGSISTYIIRIAFPVPSTATNLSHVKLMLFGGAGRVLLLSISWDVVPTKMSTSAELVAKFLHTVLLSYLSLPMVSYEPS